MWIHLLALRLIEGASDAKTPSAKKVGGDDVPRVEVWTKRKGKKKDDEALEQTIRATYDKLTGKTALAEVVNEAVFNDSDEDEEMLLLLVL